jgi:hypothetical protein
VGGKTPGSVGDEMADDLAAIHLCNTAVHL